MQGRIKLCCKRHPDQPVVGVCSSCLRERLFTLTADLEAEAADHYQLSVQLPSQSPAASSSHDQHQLSLTKSADSLVKRRLDPSSSPFRQRQLLNGKTSADMVPGSGDLLPCHVTTNAVRPAAKRKQLSLINDLLIDSGQTNVASQVPHSSSCNLQVIKQQDVQLAAPSASSTVGVHRQNVFTGPAAALSNTKCCLRRHHSQRRNDNDDQSQAPAVVLDQAPFSPSLMSTISYEDHRTSYDILFTGNLQDAENGNTTRLRNPSASRKPYKKKLSKPQKFLLTSSPLQGPKQGRRSSTVDAAGHNSNNMTAEHHCNPADEQYRRNLHGFASFTKTNGPKHRITKCPAPTSATTGAAATSSGVAASQRLNIDWGAGLDDVNGVMIASSCAEQPPAINVAADGSNSWFLGFVNQYRIRKQRRRSKSIATFSSTANAAYNLCISPDILYPYDKPAARAATIRHTAGRHSVDSVTASRARMHGEDAVELDDQLRKKFASLFDGASETGSGTCRNSVSDVFKIDKQVQVDEQPAATLERCQTSTQRMKLANFLVHNTEDDQEKLHHHRRHHPNQGHGGNNVVQQNTPEASSQVKLSNECPFWGGCPSLAATPLNSGPTAVNLLCSGRRYTSPVDRTSRTYNCKTSTNPSWMGLSNECLSVMEGGNVILKGPSSGSTLLKGCSGAATDHVNSMCRCTGTNTDFVRASNDSRHSHEMIPPVRANNNVNMWRKFRVMAGLIKSATTSSKDIDKPSEDGISSCNRKHILQPSGHVQSKSSDVDNHKTDRIYFNDRYVKTFRKSADDIQFNCKEGSPPVGGFISCNSSPTCEMPQYSAYCSTELFDNHHRHAVEGRSSPETANSNSAANSFWSKDYSAFSFYFSPSRKSSHQKNYVTPNANADVINNQQAYVAGRTSTAAADDQFSRIVFCHHQTGSSSSSRRSVDGSSCGFMRAASTCT